MLPVIKGKYHYADRERLVIDVVKIVAILNNKNLSRGAIQLLAYYILYGISKETHTQFVDAYCVKEMQGVYNLRNQLRGMGLLIENEDEGVWEIDTVFKFQVEDKVGFQLLLYTEEVQ